MHRLAGLLHSRGRSARATRFEANNLSVAGSVLPLRFFDYVVEPKAKSGCQLLANGPHICNNRISFHRRSPVFLGACK
jgi:hypothetical protein